MNFIFVLAIMFIVMILLSVPSSVLFVQDASALLPVAQITSAKADGSSIVNGGFANIAEGKNTVRVTFDYRGFDDNDHIVELRCSWDGVSYQKNNCTSESAEQQATLTGPDGVLRTYNIKTGTASRELAAPPVPKTYTFGVKVLNDNGNLGPATTWSFKMRSDTSPPVGGGTEEGGTGDTVEPEIKRTITVTFNSITVHDDHTPDAPITLGGGKVPTITTTPKRAGEWSIDAYVQGELVNLFTDKELLSGKTYQLENKKVTVNIKPDLPLSIFTFGVYPDFPTIGPFEYGYCTDLYDESQGPKIFTHPAALWKDKIIDFQDQPICIDERDSEDDSYKKIGFVSTFILPPDYKSWLTPEQVANFPTSPFMKYALDFATGPDFVVTSSTKDFTLRYTLQIDSDHRD